MLKKIEWKELLDAQRNLDLHTFELRGLSYEATAEKRLLALLVELHELANETKCFKFWSVKATGNREKILMEYVDVLHFILSIFCARGESMDGIGIRSDLAKEDGDFTSAAFLELVVGFSSLVKNMFNMERHHESGLDTPNEQIHEEFKVWTQKFIDLASYLGFGWSEVVEAYWKKWKINIERQNSKSY